MEKIIVDNNQGFDFGKTSKEYAKYRDIYPAELYEKLYSLGVGKAGTSWLDLGTGTGVIPRGLATHGADITATDISKEQIEQAEILSANFKNIKYSIVSAEEVDFPENSFDVITACQCFWYFDPNVIVPKIKKMITPGGMFLKVYMSWLKDDPIAEKSTLLVRELNNNWQGASPSVQDLKTHYFENPHMESFYIDIPFTKESWHGRIKACRGVLASMDEKTFSEFDRRHREMIAALPDTFTVRHKVFLTYYHIKKNRNLRQDVIL